MPDEGPRTWGGSEGEPRAGAPGCNPVGGAHIAERTVVGESESRHPCTRCHVERADTPNAVHVVILGVEAWKAITAGSACCQQRIRFVAPAVERWGLRKGRDA